MSEEKKWWYAKADKKLGPYTATELKSLVASGEIKATDQVWKDGLANWVPASSVSGLFASSAPPPLYNASPQPNAPPPIRAGASSSTNAQSKKPFSLLTKIVMWVGGIFFGFIILAVIFAPDSKNKTSSSADSVETEQTEKPIYVGETFKTEKFEITVQSAQARRSVGNSFFSSQPAEGAIYIAVVTNYKNISQKPASVGCAPRTRINTWCAQHTLQSGKSGHPTLPANIVLVFKYI